MSGDDLAIALFLWGVTVALVVAVVTQVDPLKRKLNWFLLALAALFAVAGFIWPSIKSASPYVQRLLGELASSPSSWLALALFGLGAVVVRGQKPATAQSADELPMTVLETPIDNADWSVWRLRTEFTVFEASAILAECEPGTVNNNAQQQAFEKLLLEALKKGDLPFTPQRVETYGGGYHTKPTQYTPIPKEALIAYCKKHAINISHIE